jgi:RNA polymerase sigma-70 factor, ECF subfamily
VAVYDLRILVAIDSAQVAARIDRFRQLPMPDLIFSSSAVEALPSSGATVLAPRGSPPLAAADDRTLIERAQTGDRAAFELLVQRYDRQVLRLALNVLGSPDDARDVYQEAFLKIYRNLHRFRFECAFYTWIYRIVTNICLDHLRRRRSHPEEQPPVLRSASADERRDGDFFDHQQQTAPYSDPERQVLGREIGLQVEWALEALSPRERMVFEMRHYQGMKLRAIGEALGTTEETVKNSLFRATHKLRSRLEGLR